VAASLIFLSAYGGMVSLAQVAVYGVAGFALGNLTTNGNTKGLNLGWAEAPGIVVALAVAAAVGLASLTKGKKERIRRAQVVRDEALRALELNPRHDGAYHILGRWNAEIMRLSGLSRFFARSFLGAGVFKQASWEEAIANLQRAVQLDPGRIYHRLELAEVYADRKQWDDARAELDRVQTLPDREVLDPLYRARAAELAARIADKH